MKLHKLLYVILCVTTLSCTTSGGTALSPDINLIVPGEMAEGYKLNTVIKDTEINEIKIIDSDISIITNIKNFRKLHFDSIIFKNDSAVLFLENKIIIAIAGLKIERRVTSNAALLSDGCSNFTLNYERHYLETITKENHKVYIYNKYGIALFDDNNDNVIDMYLIFKN